MKLCFVSALCCSISSLVLLSSPWAFPFCVMLAITYSFVFLCSVKHFDFCLIYVNIPSLMYTVCYNKTNSSPHFLRLLLIQDLFNVSSYTQEISSIICTYTYTVLISITCLCMYDKYLWMSKKSRRWQSQCSRFLFPGGSTVVHKVILGHS